MRLVHLKGRIVFIFIIINILISISLLSEASQNCQMDILKESPNSLGIIPRIFIGAKVVGDASSGKLIGNFSRIGIIKFDYVKFYIIRIFLFRENMIDKINATAILFGIDQEIPEGSFKFKAESIFFAIVF